MTKAPQLRHHLYRATTTRDFETDGGDVVRVTVNTIKIGRRDKSVPAPEIVVEIASPVAKVKA